LDQIDLHVEVPLGRFHGAHGYDHRRRILSDHTQPCAFSNTRWSSSTSPLAPTTGSSKSPARSRTSGAASTSARTTCWRRSSTARWTGSCSRESLSQDTGAFTQMRPLLPKSRLKIPLCEITFKETSPIGISLGWDKLTATWKGHELGYLDSVNQGDGTILLSDVVVYSAVRARVGILPWVIRRFRPKWGMLYPRRSGVGTVLVKHFLGSCEQRGFKEVFGNVTPHGVQTFPFLEKWYQNLGFKIGPSDGRAEFGSIAFKIIWNPRRTQPEPARDGSL